MADSSRSMLPVYTGWHVDASRQRVVVAMELGDRMTPLYAFDRRGRINNVGDILCPVDDVWALCVSEDGSRLFVVTCALTDPHTTVHSYALNAEGTLRGARPHASFVYKSGCRPTTRGRCVHGKIVS